MKMNSKIKRKLALVLSAAMVFTAVPMSAIAAESTGTEAADPKGTPSNPDKGTPSNPNHEKDGTIVLEAEAVNGKAEANIGASRVTEDEIASGAVTIEVEVTGEAKEVVITLGDKAGADDLLTKLADVSKTTIKTPVGNVILPKAAFEQLKGKGVANFTIKKNDVAKNDAGKDAQTFTVGFFKDDDKEAEVKGVTINFTLKSDFAAGKWVKVVSNDTDNRGKKKVDKDQKISFYMTHLSTITATETSEPYSYAGSGSVGGGSGSSSGMAYGRTMSPNVKGPFTDVSYAIMKQYLPSYVLDGKWSKSADGSWSCLNPSTNTKYAGAWAAIYNPYSTDIAANSFGWFYFGLDGKMQTGWFTDPATGLRYYLNPNSDGTLGSMATGWTQIAGQWYYFSDVSDGNRGHLLTDTITPDGKTVDANGVWVQ